MAPYYLHGVCKDDNATTVGRTSEKNNKRPHHRSAIDRKWHKRLGKKRARKALSCDLRVRLVE